MSAKEAAVSSENKIIARYVSAAFGGTPHVDEYLNESETLTVGILHCRDRPAEGVTSYSTIKLSDHPMKQGEREFPIRLELAGVCINIADWFPNVLASAAFSIMQDDAVYHPGSVLPDHVCQSCPSSKFPHLYLTAPFLWERELKTLDCGTKKASWLMAVPISEAEYAYVRKFGDYAFERLLEKQHGDFSNPDRPSVL
jgi:hypothetical protein